MKDSIRWIITDKISGKHVYMESNLWLADEVELCKCLDNALIFDTKKEAEDFKLKYKYTWGFVDCFEDITT